MINLLGNRIVASKPVSVTDYFITSWSVSAGEVITLPLIASGTFNFTVDWGDGSATETITTNAASHTYASAGTFDISILGVLTQFSFNNTGNILNLVNIKQWGLVEFSILDFYGCDNLTAVTPTDTPIFSVGASFVNLFYNCTNLTSISNIQNWDVSNVVNFSRAFRDAISFNSDLSSWDVSNATSLNQMFYDAINFTSDLSSWDVSICTNMGQMFHYAWVFQSDLSSWNTSNVTTMYQMFRRADLFQSNLGSWNVTSLTDAAGMFLSITLTTSNYDALLVGWDAQVLQSGVTFDGGGSKYTIGSAAETARANMISSDGWTITDGGGI